MVVLDGEESGSVPVSSGVTQDSVLVPILSLAYVNDLPAGLSSQICLFANDAAMYLTVGGAEDGQVLQNDLDSVQGLSWGRLGQNSPKWDPERSGSLSKKF